MKSSFPCLFIMMKRTPSCGKRKTTSKSLVKIDNIQGHSCLRARFTVDPNMAPNRDMNHKIHMCSLICMSVWYV